MARAHQWTVVDLAEAYLRAGVRFLQVRAKRAAGAHFLAVCDAIIPAARRSGARIIVNDRADIALISGADGVHVGLDDLSPRDARAVLGPRAIIGCSTHTAEQIDAARAEPVDYVAVGPIFGTATKKDVGYNPSGLEFVRLAAARTDPLPVVAIGGITLDNARSVIEAGASSVAVISDLLSDGYPEKRARAFVNALDPR